VICVNITTFLIGTKLHYFYDVFQLLVKNSIDLLTETINVYFVCCLLMGRNVFFGHIFFVQLIVFRIVINQVIYSLFCVILRGLLSD